MSFEAKGQSGDVTRLLQQETPDYHGVLRVLYRDLCALAQSKMSSERRDHTLSATALVHEAFLRVADGEVVDWKDRAHFFHVAALAMRRVLIDHARASNAVKRSGDGIIVHGTVRVDPDLIQTAADLLECRDEEAIVNLEQALARLEGHDEELAALVRLRFYAGLSLEHAAAAMGMSLSTAKRRWSFARAILIRAMRE
jgi:RNA polymerase sigma factor (TIGR02999 family)